MRLRLAASVLVVALGTSCAKARSAPLVRVEGGNADRGRREIAAYGCGSCHMIPGITGADGLVGPPLIRWSQRKMIAGEIPNTPDNLVYWIAVPQSIEPGTAMPNLGVSDGQARDIAAYLYTIK